MRAVFGSIIDDTAQINLEVYFPVPGQKHIPQPPQPFSKSEFISFVDNVLYSVNSYHFKASVGDLVLSGDKATGTVAFTAAGSAQGVSSALMEAGSQFFADADCKARLRFDAQAKPTLTELSCEVRLGR